MSIARRHFFSWVICALVASFAGRAHGQPAPAPPSQAPGAAPRGSGSEPAAQDAANRAKAAGQVIEVSGPEAVAGCRSLGEDHMDSSAPGERGQLEIRAALQAMARERGASHIAYSRHIVIVDGHAQREYGAFYDCTASPDPVSSPAPAGPPIVPPVVAARAQHLVAVSAQLEILPVGTLDAGSSNMSAEVAAATAYGVSGNLEYFLSPYAALGLNPGMVLGLRPEGAGQGGTTAATEVDMRARLRFGKLVGDGLGGQVSVSGGGSWIITPNGGKTLSGVVAGIAAAVSHTVEHTAFVTLELGFQFGFQGTTVNGADVELSSQLFHIGLGFGWYL